MTEQTLAGKATLTSGLLLERSVVSRSTSTPAHTLVDWDLDTSGPTALRKWFKLFFFFIHRKRKFNKQLLIVGEVVGFLSR